MVSFHTEVKIRSAQSVQLGHAVTDRDEHAALWRVRPVTPFHFQAPKGNEHRSAPVPAFLVVAAGG